jgi:hypothetical protein
MNMAERIKDRWKNNTITDDGALKASARRAAEAAENELRIQRMSPREWYETELPRYGEITEEEIFLATRGWSEKKRLELMVIVIEDMKGQGFIDMGDCPGYKFRI